MKRILASAVLGILLLSLASAFPTVAASKQVEITWTVTLVEFLDNDGDGVFSEGDQFMLAGSASGDVSGALVLFVTLTSVQGGTAKFSVVWVIADPDDPEAFLLIGAEEGTSNEKQMRFGSNGGIILASPPFVGLVGANSHTKGTMDAESGTAEGTTRIK